MNDREPRTSEPTSTATPAGAGRAGAGPTSRQLPARASSALPQAAPPAMQAALAVQLKASDDVARRGFEGDPFGLGAPGAYGAGDTAPLGTPLQSADAAPGPGAAVQRKGAKDHVPTQTRVTPDQELANGALHQLKTAEDRAEKIWRDVSAQTKDPAAACAELASLVSGTFAAVDQLGGLFATHADGQASADEALGSLNPFKWANADRAAEGLAPLALALEKARPEIYDALNNLVRLGLQTMRRASPGPELQALAGTIHGLSTRAAPLGWIRPESLEQADERRFAHEACPDGAMDERPDVCTMTDTEREKEQRKAVHAMDQVVAKFFKACRNEKAALQAMIDADKAVGQFIGGIAIELIVGAVTGGGGKGASAASAALGEAGKATVRRAPDLNKLTQHLTKYGGKLGTQKAGGAAGGMPEERTLDAIDQLEHGFRTAVEELGGVLGEFDDTSLRELTFALELFSEEVAEERVKRFVAAYRAQVEPIGTEDRRFAQSQDPNARDLPATVTIRAARIHPLRGAPRLALVRHITDALPGIRRAGRAIREGAGFAVDRGIDALTRNDEARDDSSSAPAPAPTSAPPTATQPARHPAAHAGRDVAAEQFHFMRWIDDDMAPLAEPEAIDLASVVVQGVSWTEGLLPRAPAKE